MTPRNPFSIQAIEGYLYAQYIDDLSPLQAHQKLLKVTVEETFTLEQVETQFEAFKAREYTMRQVEHPPTDGVQPLFKVLDIHIVRDNVMQHLNLDNRLTIRKVCKNLRGIMDNQNLHFNKITLKLESKEIQLTADDHQWKYIWPVEGHGGCVVTHNGRIKFDREMDFETRCGIDLMALFGNRTLTIQEFEVIDGFEDRWLTGSDMEFATEKLLKDAPEVKPRLTKFTMTTTTLDEAVPFLKVFRENSIETIELKKKNIDEQREEFNRIRRELRRLRGEGRNNDDLLKATPQFKNAKVLVTDFFLTNVMDYIHLDYVDFHVDEENGVDWEDLKKLKEALRDHKTLQKFEVILSDSDTFTPGEEENRKFQEKLDGDPFDIITTSHIVQIRGPFYDGDKMKIKR